MLFTLLIVSGLSLQSLLSPSQRTPCFKLGIRFGRPDKCSVQRGRVVRSVLLPSTT